MVPDIIINNKSIICFSFKKHRFIIKIADIKMVISAKEENWKFVMISM